jgi:hypothetical protein
METYIMDLQNKEEIRRFTEEIEETKNEGRNSPKEIAAIEVKIEELTRLLEGYEQEATRF